MKNPRKLFTKEFVALSCIAFLSNTNMAVFFQFHHYLSTLSIGMEWFGTILGMFSITALVLRPLINPFLHPGNARLWMVLGTAGVMLSLWGYALALGLWGMILIRILHGMSYVVMGTAFTAILVRFIPKSRSGQAFGLMTVIMLLPFAIIPPALNYLIKDFGGFIGVLNATALFMALVFPLSLVVKPPAQGSRGGTKDFISGGEFLRDLRDRRVSLILLLMLLLYTGYAPVFFFLDRYAAGTGIKTAGVFFTISIITEIAIRVLAGRLFDRINKPLLAVASFLAVGMGYVLLAHLSGKTMLYGLGVFLGLGWGVIMPILNALMFDVSPVRLKGFNTNLGMQMFQAGFFVGPIAGGTILTYTGFRGLYYFCAGCAFCAMMLAPFIGVKGERENPEMTRREGDLDGKESEL